MKCPLCNCELFIGKSRYILKESEGKVFIEQDFVCRNDKCNNKDKVVDTDIEELPVQTR